jgi:hypothetical protein
MSLLWASVVVIGVAACAIAAMLLVRRRAPDGSYFDDADRAAGVFGVLAIGFAVLAGFVVFLAFESYDTSRSGAGGGGTHRCGAVRDGAVAADIGARATVRRAGVLWKQEARVAGGVEPACDAAGSPTRA